MLQISSKRTGSTSSKKVHCVTHKPLFWGSRTSLFNKKFIINLIIIFYRSNKITSNISLLIVLTIVWCRLFQHRLYKTYFNICIVWIPQYIVSHLYNYYSIVDVEGLMIIYSQSYLNLNKSYKTYFVITDIIMYYLTFISNNIGILLCISY